MITTYWSQNWWLHIWPFIPLCQVRLCLMTWWANSDHWTGKQQTTAKKKKQTKNNRFIVSYWVILYPFSGVDELGLTNKGRNKILQPKSDLPFNYKHLQGVLRNICHTTSSSTCQILNTFINSFSLLWFSQAYILVALIHLGIFKNLDWFCFAVSVCSVKSSFFSCLNVENCLMCKDDISSL